MSGFFEDSQREEGEPEETESGKDWKNTGRSDPYTGLRRNNSEEAQNVDYSLRAREEPPLSSPLSTFVTFAQFSRRFLGFINVAGSWIPELFTPRDQESLLFLSRFLDVYTGLLAIPDKSDKSAEVEQK